LYKTYDPLLIHHPRILPITKGKKVDAVVDSKPNWVRGNMDNGTISMFPFSYPMGSAAGRRYGNNSC
jgi:hypothetical protein